MLGGLLAICSAATFAFNNASVRRGVLTGSVAQAMAITVPIGVPLFFLAALLTGRLGDVFGILDAGLCRARTRRHSALRVGPLLQLSRHARDRHQPGRADPAVQPARHPDAGDLASGRGAHGAQAARHRSRAGRAERHHARAAGPRRSARSPTRRSPRSTPSARLRSSRNTPRASRSRCCQRSAMA